MSQPDIADKTFTWTRVLAGFALLVGFVLLVISFVIVANNGEAYFLAAAGIACMPLAAIFAIAAAFLKALLDIRESLRLRKR